MRVTHVVVDLDAGGLESVVYALARQFAGSPVVMSVITLSGRVGRVGADTRPLVDQFHVMRPVPKLSMVHPAGLANRIRRTKAEVVHLHSGGWYRSAKAARMAGVQGVVYTEHGLSGPNTSLQRWLRRHAAERTDVVVPVSETLRRHIVEADGVPVDRVQVIENGIDTQRFCPGPVSQELRAALKIPPGARVVGSLGRFEAVKAYENLIQAFAALDSEALGGVPPVLVLCGDGQEQAKLRQLSNELGVHDRVRFPGWVDDPVSFYRLFDVFALTSLSEGMPMSLLEAMASGALPVVTAVGACAEVVGPALSRQVVPPGNIEAISQALLSTFQLGQRRSQLVAHARARIVDSFSLERMASEYERVYRRLGA
jgi:glycosyltransferase involved in cell wall biosynthesis